MKSLVLALVTFLFTTLFSQGALAIAIAEPDLKPWEITRLSSTSPPNRPGDGPGIPSRVALKIADRNGYADSASAPESTCVVEWLYLEDPFGREFNCTPVEYGEWSILMEEGDLAGNVSPTTDFRLRIMLVRGGGVGGGREVFAGEAAFKVGENMRGLCSAGGMCSFSLKEEMVPFRVLQARMP
jgi:hypothetical protein